MEEKEREISVKDIVRIIKKNLIFILITSLVFAACSFFITKFFIQKTYTSSVKLYVETESGNLKASEYVSMHTYAEKLVATYIEMLNTNSFFVDVSDELNEKYTATELSKMISFADIENTEVFKSNVISKSPTDSKNIADAVAKIAPRTISKINKNATLKIVDEATIPKTPASPNTSRNVMLALLAGLVISLVISFARDILDVKLKYNDEMTTINGIPVLAAIPDFENLTSKGGNSKRKKDWADKKEIY